jgi:hypothetical protein
MKKAVISFGYVSYVMDAERAITLLGLLESAEMYEGLWKPEASGGMTHHIYPQDNTKVVPMQLMPDNLYRLAKLAGKPEGR